MKLDKQFIILSSSSVLLLALVACSSIGPVLLYISGLLVSALLGISGYLALRLKFSSPFKSIPKFPEQASNFQRSLFESISAANGSQEKESGVHQLGASSLPTPSPYISRSIDQEINDVIEEITENYLFNWLRNLIGGGSSSTAENESENEIKKIIRRDFWSGMQNLSERMSRLDPVILLTNDFVRRVTSHFEKIRLAQQRGTPPTTAAHAAHQQQTAKNEAPTFHIYPHLISRQREEEFLTKLSEVLIAFLLPTTYSNCSSTRHLLKELLGRKVLYAAIDAITNPDFVNTKILSWIAKYQCKTTTSATDGAQNKGFGHSKAFNYAASYDEFLASIGNCGDADALKHLRFNILTEIVQATQMDHLNSAKGHNTNPDSIEEEGDDEAEDESESNEKLKRYISQLVQARNVCEKRLGELQGRNHLSIGGSDSLDEPHPSDLTFRSVMNSPFSRKYLYAFLESRAPPQHDLLGFWTAVEELKESDRTQWHQLATEIFYTYINKPNGAIRIRKTGLKRIEEFLLGDATPYVFYEIQADVLKTLEEKHFPTFLQSDKCRRMLNDARENGITFGEPLIEPEQSHKPEDPKNPPDETSSSDEAASGSVLVPTEALHFADQSSFAKSQLEHVVERLQNKMQALKALRSSLKPDSKVLKMLQGEIEFLEEDRHQMEQHLMRTEAWSEHLGRWRCHIQSVEHIEELECLQVVLIVHVPIDKNEDFNDRGKKSGVTPPPPPSWVCTRQMGEFHTLHRNLTPYVTWIKNMDLPNSPKSIFGGGKQTSKPWQDKAKSMLQSYLDSVLVDDRLNQSEIIYSFLSPSPDYLKTASSLPPSITRTSSRNKRPRGRRPLQRQPQKFTSSLSNLFRHSDSPSYVDNDQDSEGFHEVFDGKSESLPPRRDEFSFIRSASGDSSAQEEDDHFWLDEFDASRNFDADGGDAIAEPLYALVGEVFDMRGVFKILRKSLIAVVQMTYSVSINRQLRDTVSWLTSEHMIVHYIQSLRRACATSPDEKQPRSQEQMTVTRKEAKELVLRHIPEILVNLVGQQAARNGAAKVFETLQDQTLNKQLFYEILEHLSNALFPELLVNYAEQKMRSFS